MSPDEKYRAQAREAETAVAGWRLRWGLFSLVWALLVLLLAAWLWPALVGYGRPGHEVLAGVALVALGPPALDYAISSSIARLLQQRLHGPR